MSMTEQEKAEAAERRAEDRMQAALEREKERQQRLVEVLFHDEDQRKITYLNRQLLRRERASEWDFLRTIRKDLVRHYGLEDFE